MEPNSPGQSLAEAPPPVLSPDAWRGHRQQAAQAHHHAMAQPPPPPMAQAPAPPPGHRRPARHPAFGPGGEQQQLAGPLEDERHTLGMSVLAFGVGAALGYHFGGGGGAAAGALWGGALVNAYRAITSVASGTEEDDREAAVSATWALVNAAAGGYVWYKLASKDESSQPPPQTVEAGQDCPIRPVGP